MAAARLTQHRAGRRESDRSRRRAGPAASATLELAASARHPQARGAPARRFFVDQDAARQKTERALDRAHVLVGDEDSRSLSPPRIASTSEIRTRSLVRSSSTIGLPSRRQRVAIRPLNRRQPRAMYAKLARVATCGARRRRTRSYAQPTCEPGACGNDRKERLLGVVVSLDETAAGAGHRRTRGARRRRYGARQQDDPVADGFRRDDDSGSRQSFDLPPAASGCGRC